MQLLINLIFEAIADTTDLFGLLMGIFAGFTSWLFAIGGSFLV